MNAIENALGYILPKVRDLIFLIVLISVLLLGQRMMNIDGDLGRHLTIGQYIIETRSIPVNDLFSHTMYGENLTPHEWLAQVIFGSFYKAMGLPGVVLVCGLILAITFSLLFSICVEAGAGIIGSLFAVCLAIIGSSLHWLTRPHLFTILFLTIWVYILGKMRRNDFRYWWILPVSMIFWVNTHGAYIAGLVTFLLFLFGTIWEQLLQSKSDQRINLLGEGKWWLISGFLAFVFTFLNPVGWKIWVTSIGYLQNKYLVSHTAEYFSPNFHESSTWPFLLSIALIIFIFGLFRPKIPAAYIFPMTGWVIMALYSIRNIPLFFIVFSPALALALKIIMDRSFSVVYSRYENKLSGIDRKLSGWTLPIISFLLLVAIFCYNPKGLKDYYRFSNEVFPVEAANWLEVHPQSGNVFNYFPWGGYLLYRFWPNILVFIDGQTDFYGEKLTREYESVISLDQNWNEILDLYHVSWVLLPAEYNLSIELTRSYGWDLLYEDANAKILRKIGQ